MAPVVWLIGIPWAEGTTAGALMGVKTILNELIALPATRRPATAGALTSAAPLIMTYALCGFANFGSLGILIGGLGAMAPQQRGEIVALGIKSIVWRNHVDMHGRRHRRPASVTSRCRGEGESGIVATKSP